MTEKEFSKLINEFWVALDRYPEASFEVFLEEYLMTKLNTQEHLDTFLAILNDAEEINNNGGNNEKAEQMLQVI